MIKKVKNTLKQLSLLILLLSSIGITSLMAQHREGGWSLGLDGGLMMFYGDVKNFDF